MKSLETIQKTFHVFEILTKIAMILSFVWAGLAALGMLCCAVWYYGGTVIGANLDLFYLFTETSDLLDATGVLLTDTIFAVTDGILFAFADSYLKSEQTDGTPFTKRGADEIKRLGIRVIVMMLVAVILAAIVSAVFELPEIGIGRECIASIFLGIVLIITSLIFRYGAELESQK